MQNLWVTTETADSPKPSETIQNDPQPTKILCNQPQTTHN